jgi:ATP-dependent RNA/DNA helicase IGHMBP2
VAAAGGLPGARLPALTSAAVASGGGLTDSGDVELDTAALGAAMLLVDTAGCGLEEVTDAGSESRANVGEADVVVKHVLALLAVGVQPAAIAVITPYNAQVGLLKAMLGAVPGLEVRSVDGFQGQEKEAIVLSLVRSNVARAAGFLADYRRLNVAVTRARRHVCVVGDSDTVSGDVFVRGLLRYLNAHGEVRSAAEYVTARAAGGDAAGAAASFNFVASAANAGPPKRRPGLGPGAAGRDPAAEAARAAARRARYGVFEAQVAASQPAATRPRGRRRRRRRRRGGGPRRCRRRRGRGRRWSRRRRRRAAARRRPSSGGGSPAAAGRGRRRGRAA